MDTDAKKTIEGQFLKLPPVVQKAIQSVNLREHVAAIAKKNQLHVDQAGQLEDEIVLIMLGLTDPNEFAQHLSKNLKVDDAKAEALANDIAQEIMLPVREAMQKFMESPDTKPEQIKEATVQKEPSVVMPSAVKPATPAVPASTPAPVVATAAPAPTTPAIPPKPAALLDAHPANIMLSEPTVSMPPKPATPPVTLAPTTTPAVSPATPAASAPEIKVEPPKAAPPYKADPYREAPE